MMIKSQNGLSITNVQVAADVRCRHLLYRSLVMCRHLAMGYFDTPERAGQVVSEIQTLVRTGCVGTYKVPAE